MGDPMPPPADRNGLLALVLAEHDRRLRELEAPAGTQRNLVVRNLREQIAELQRRSTHIVTPANLNIGMGTPGTFYSGTRSFQMPGPQGGARSAILMVSATLTNSAGLSNSISAFGDLIYQSASRWRGRATVPATTSSPGGWAETLAAFAPVVVPAGADPVFALNVQGTTFVASPVPTLTVSNITATLLYGDRI